MTEDSKMTTPTTTSPQLLRTDSHHCTDSSLSPTPVTIAVVTAGASHPSTTTMLGQQVAAEVTRLARRRGLQAHIRLIELRYLATDIARALVSQHISAPLQDALDTLRDVDALIVSSPVYKAGPSGMFTSFFQILDNDLLIGTPVLLTATGGSARHALVVDDQLRGLFAYLRTVTTPTSLYATPNDWGNAELSSRITRAATELVALIEGGFRTAVRDEAWGNYPHSFGSAGGTEMAISMESDLMRLATGGSAT